MEWGIMKGNDPYLYGEKVKGISYEEGRESCRDLQRYPNDQVGYGRLCLSESIPK